MELRKRGKPFELSTKSAASRSSGCAARNAPSPLPSPQCFRAGMEKTTDFMDRCTTSQSAKERERERETRQSKNHHEASASSASAPPSPPPVRLGGVGEERTYDIPTVETASLVMLRSQCSRKSVTLGPTDGRRCGMKKLGGGHRVIRFAAPTLKSKKKLFRRC